MDMPKDSAILLSVINTKLRDFYGSLDRLCEDMEWNKDEIVKQLSEISYSYDQNRNQFI